MRDCLERVQHALQKFYIPDQRLLSIAAQIRRQMESGLARKDGTSSIPMLPSFVPFLPDGTERGKYVSIDLSGKNLRILLLTLNGSRKDVHMDTANYMIPDAVMKGTGTQLFDLIAESLHRFLESFDLHEANLPLGFVFSYPCELHSATSARLLWWTKGFDIPDCLHKDVVVLLEEALRRQNKTRVQLKVVMNDTVGQLAAAAFQHGSDCTIGVVVGYGCNSAYLERTARITKLDSAASGFAHDRMVVVTEWEEFGSKGELDDVLTDFDREVDEESVHRGKQIIDKLTGAMYLGAVVRSVMLQLILDGELFDGQPCERLEQNDSFPTKFITEILGEEEGSFRVCRRVCDDLEVVNHGSNDYTIIREICHAVSMRSASLVAAAISALLAHAPRDPDQGPVRIGIGGALVQFHPTYLALLDDVLQRIVELDQQTTKWTLVSANEGSARGAALLAAVADRSPF